MHLPTELSETTELQAPLKPNKMMFADRICQLVDHSKIGVRTFIRVAPWSAIPLLITGHVTVPALLSAVAGLGVEGILAPSG